VKDRSPLLNGAFVTLLVASLPALAKEWPCTKITSLPTLIDGCEGERCQSRDNKVIKDVLLYAKPDLRSRVVAQIKRGRPAQRITHKTLLKQMGTFVVGKGNPEPEAYWAIQELKQHGVEMGDVILGLQDGGEGLYKHCIGDKLFYLKNAYGLVPKTPLVTEAWSFVRSSEGNGWAPGADWYVAQVQ